MIVLFQILFTLFALFAIASVFKRKKEGLLGPKGLVFWVMFWLLAIVAVLWPDSTTQLANLLGIGRGSDFVLYVAIALLFYLVFKLHIKLESVGRDITRVVRKEAVEEGIKIKE